MVRAASSLRHAATGIRGLDEMLDGGIPRGRATLLIGGPGSGKTVLALETLVRGAVQHEEPGIFVTFEESAERIVSNASGFGWDLPGLLEKSLFFIDARPSPELVQSGSFDVLELLLYVAGEAPNSALARINLHRLCREHLPAQHRFEIVDVLTHPERALAEGVLLALGIPETE
ncbi:MAG TPA: ATPase domain-containing protein [Thermoanaerobaculia bacterium]|nr:ATPase domain-containing protein [Thermoanaerobaculia bacterium]